MNATKESISMTEFNDWAPTPQRILDFLKNSKKAYTPKGLAIALKMDKDGVGSYLAKLKSKGLVVNKQPYWAFNFKKGRR